MEGFLESKALLSTVFRVFDAGIMDPASVRWPKSIAVVSMIEKCLSHFFEIELCYHVVPLKQNCCRATGNRRVWFSPCASALHKIVCILQRCVLEAQLLAKFFYRRHASYGDCWFWWHRRLGQLGAKHSRLRELRAIDNSFWSRERRWMKNNPAEGWGWLRAEQDSKSPAHLAFQSGIWERPTASLSFGALRKVNSLTQSHRKLQAKFRGPIEF